MPYSSHGTVHALYIPLLLHVLFDLLFINFPKLASRTSHPLAIPVFTLKHSNFPFSHIYAYHLHLEFAEIGVLLFTLPPILLPLLYLVLLTLAAG